MLERAASKVASSTAFALTGSAEIQSQLTSPDLDVPQLSALMEAFVRDAEGGRHLEAGWPDTCYGVSESKAGVWPACQRGPSGWLAEAGRSLGRRPEARGLLWR